MKHKNTHVIATVAAISAGLLMAKSAQAQGITGGQYLQMATPLSGDGYSGNWNAGDVANTATGIEIVAPTTTSTFGSFSTLYSPIASPQPNSAIAGDTKATFDFTFNSATFAAGVAVIFSLDDSLGNAEYYDFGYPNRTLGLNSVTVNLNSTTLADIAAGAVIDGFNLQMDPANISSPTYDVTFNSITLSGAPVPEPSTFAYSAFGAVAIWLFRRRK